MTKKQKQCPNPEMLEEARRIMKVDWRTRSDLALEGEFNLKYGVSPRDYIEKYGTEEEIKKLPGMRG